MLALDKIANKDYSRTMQTRHWKGCALCFALIIVLAMSGGCRKKSAQAMAEENAIKRHEKQAKNQKLTYQQIRSLPSSKLIIDAGKFLYGLNEKGELPGAETNTTIMSPPMSPDAPSSYPVSVTCIQNLRLRKGLINHYTALKDSSESPWRLQKAWQTDVSTNVVQEFPVQ